jgi:hypothetical protein
VAVLPPTERASSADLRPLTIDCGPVVADCLSHVTGAMSKGLTVLDIWKSTDK